MDRPTGIHQRGDYIERNNLHHHRHGRCSVYKSAGRMGHQSDGSLHIYGGGLHHRPDLRRSVPCQPQEQERVTGEQGQLQRTGAQGRGSADRAGGPSPGPCPGHKLRQGRGVYRLYRQRGNLHHRKRRIDGGAGAEEVGAGD